MSMLALFVSVLVGFLMVFSGGIVLVSAESLSLFQPSSLTINEGGVFADVSPSMPPGDALPPLGRSSPMRGGYFSQVDDPRPGFWETSEYMLGRVGVLVVFVESTGGLDPDIEDWQEWRMNLVMRKVRSGLDWWIARYPFRNPPLEFMVSSAVGYTRYEPITRNSTDESLWIPEVLASINCGSGENYYIYAASCANEIREKWSTDWAFLIFVVDSLKDEDGMFADPPRFAYAYINGPFMVVTYDNDDWGIDRMDLVVAHEVGHIFGATDEYNGVTENSGYLYETDSDGSRCIMDGNAGPCVSVGTQRQIGWVDDDLDGYPDILENEPVIIIEKKPPNITDNESIKLEGVVKLDPYPCRRPYCRSVTINKVKPINYTGEIYSLDGKFDSAFEKFLLVYNASAAGRHQVSVSFSEAIKNLVVSYSQTVLYTYVLVSDFRGPKFERVDVGSTQTAEFRLKWAHDESAVTSGNVLINGVLAENRGDGWFGVTVTKNDVGAATLSVDYVNVTLQTNEGQAVIRKFVVTTHPVNIIFDRVIINLSSPKTRFDVDSFAEISYRAYYEYDHRDFVGSIRLNQPLRQSNVGKYTYTVVGIDDEHYGLKSFESNSVDIIFDKVLITLRTPRERIDTGSTATIIIDARYAYDYQRFSGQVFLSNLLTQTTTGKYTYRAVAISDEQYGLSRFETNEVEVVFDRVVINLSAPPRVQVGRTAPISYTAHYEYDGEKFCGKILLNRDASSSKIEKASFSVSEIIDGLYGLRSFVSNEVIVIFDSITHDLRVDTYIPFIARTVISLNYLSDNARVTGAEVSLNGEGMSEEEPGKYQLDKTVFLPIINIKIVARTENFDPYIVEKHELMIGNIALYVGLVALALVLAIRRALKKRDRTKNGRV